MTTVINNPGNGEGSGTGVIVGVLVAIIIIILFFVYGWPRLHGNSAPAANSLDVNVNLPSGDNSGAPAAQ